MDPERWRAVNDLFHRALECEEEERSAFLYDACGADADLRREVESLLASHADAAEFIETPAYEAGAELLRGRGGGPAAAESLVGKQLGPYAVKASLGYGGMGVVYLAEDTRLDRPVAIKALADHLVGDERSRERLRREAKAAAALSHSGIATVFALEEFDEHLYIVYEYAEGRTLREELDDGPLCGPRLVDTALAVARALEAAHAHGIVHRDLKPENVIRTRDGGIKILDFGLAIFAEAPVAKSGSGECQARLTLPGMLLGTPAYMAPEQLRGREVDYRADLFAFGIMLYEMASGLHPFAGGDPASTMARILEVDPRPLPEEPRSDLAEVGPVLDRLLRKNPEDRYARTSDLVADLERISAQAAAPGSHSETHAREHAAPFAPASSDLNARPAPADSSARSAPSDLSAPAPADPRARAPRHDAFWWWRFHQLALAAVYAVAFYGLWWAKEWTAGGDYSLAGAVLFYAGLVPVMGAGSLRLHLAFAARYYPGELRRQMLRAAPWIRRAELLYAPILLAAAALVSVAHPFVAAPLVAAAVGIVIFSQMIEPATTAAAFPEQ